MSHVDWCHKHGDYKGDYCGDCIEAIMKENERLREALEHIISMAGTPDAAEGCRNIIKKARAALEGK